MELFFTLSIFQHEPTISSFFAFFLLFCIMQWQSLPNWMEKSHTSSVTGGMTSIGVEGEEGMGQRAEQEQTGHVNALRL